MIYDDLKNANRYLGLSKNMDIALTYIEKNDLSLLPNGRTEILGSQIFMNVMDANTKPMEEGGYEIHKNYIDIQIDLVGCEYIIFGNDEGKVLSFDAATDFGTMQCEAVGTYKMGPGKFVICMTEEPHMAGITMEKKEKIRKAVVKVHI